MKTQRIVLCAAVIAAIFVSQSSHAAAQSREIATVTNASAVLDEIMQTPGNQIPEALLRKAEALVIIPDMIKGGFVIGARHGHGVVLVRNNQGGWDAPRFLQMTGGSVGFQAGVQSTDIILVFMTKRSVQGLLTGKFTIGADAAAAAGPVGRQLAAATDERLKAEILSYARSRGLFAGVSLDGSAIRLDPTAEAAYYRAAPGTDPNAIPPSAMALIEKVMQYSGGEVVPEPGPLTAPFVPQARGGNAEHAREQLAAAGVKLAKILPPDWQAYLAFPASVFTGEKHPSLERLQELLGRFDKVAENPQFRALSQKPEFRQVHRLIKEYIDALSEQQQDDTLQLPPAPAN